MAIAVLSQKVLPATRDADLQGVWNWNVKQLFLHVTANYSTGTDVSGRVGVNCFAYRGRAAH